MPPAARVTDPHLCPFHGGGPILPPCCSTVLIGGLPSARITDQALCPPPDVIVRGSFTVLIGGLPAARMLDNCVHGGIIAMGCPTVIIGDAGGGLSGALLGAVAGAAIGQLAGSFLGPVGALAGGLLGGLVGGVVGGLGAIAPNQGPTPPPLMGQETPMSCGVATSRMVIASETGRDVPEANLRQQSQDWPGGYDAANGTQMSNMTQLLHANGVTNATDPTQRTVGELQQATADGHPAIVHFDNPDGGGHFMVLDGVRDNPDGTRTLVLNDPWPPGTGTHSEMSEQQFADRGYSGWAITTNPH